MDGDYYPEQSYPGISDIPYPNQDMEFDSVDPPGGNYFDPFEYDQMGYGWQSYVPFQSSTPASPLEK